MKFRTLGLAVLGLLSLAACGERVQVEPAHVGKILTPSGYKPDIIPPSVFRMDHCAFPGQICDKLVTIATSDNRTVEEFRLLMPRDNLYLEFDMNIIYSVLNDEETLNRTLDRLKPDGASKNSRIMTISADNIYKTYGRPILRDVTRAVLAQYSIDEIASSRDAINQEIVTRLIETVSAEAPLAFKYAGLADVDYPQVIVDAQELRASRVIAIEKEEAEKAIRLVQISSDLEAAQAEREVRVTLAQAAREENEILAQSATREYLQYRRLEVLEKLAESENAVFVPYGALDDVGVSQRIFNGQ